MRIVAVGVEPVPLNAWTVLRLTLWYFGTQLSVAVLFGIGLGIGQALQQQSHVEERLLFNQLLFPMTCLAVLVAALVVLRQLRRNLPGGAWPSTLAALGWRPAPYRVIAAAAGAGLLLATAYLFVAYRLLPPTPHQSLGPLGRAISSSTLSGRLVLSAFSVLLAPPIEEFLFRGIVLAGLGASWGFWPAVVGSTSFFALAHLPQMGDYWPAFVGILIVAATAVAIRLATRSLWPSIAFHSAYNTVLMALLMARAT